MLELSCFRAVYLTYSLTVLCTALAKRANGHVVSIEQQSFMLNLISDSVLFNASEQGTQSERAFYIFQNIQ